MKKFSLFIFIFCAFLLMSAAFPVFGQNKESVRAMEFNKKPINDFADYVLEKVEKEKLDLSQPFKVVLEGFLVKKTENDREMVVLDQQKSKWIQLSSEEAGNPEVAKIAKKAVEAVSDSGILVDLYNFGIKDFRLAFYQNESEFVINFESEQETVQRAKTLASGFNGLLSMAKMMVKSGDEKFLLSGFQTPNAKDKSLTLNFELSKNTIHEIIDRNLANYKNGKLSEQK